MARTSAPLSRLVIVSTALALLTGPIAAAQTVIESQGSAPTDRPLLSRSALARLVQRAQPATAKAPLPDSRRPSLLHQVTTAMTLQPQTAPPAAATHRSWVARNKSFTAFLIGVGAVVGLMFVAYAAGWGDWGE